MSAKGEVAYGIIPSKKHDGIFDTHFIAKSNIKNDDKNVTLLESFTADMRSLLGDFKSSKYPKER